MLRSVLILNPWVYCFYQPKLIKSIQVFHELISIHISIRNLSATMEFPSLESQYAMNKIPEQSPSNRIPERPPSNSPCETKGKKKRERYPYERETFNCTLYKKRFLNNGSRKMHMKLFFICTNKISNKTTSR